MFKQTIGTSFLRSYAMKFQTIIFFLFLISASWSQDANKYDSLVQQYLQLNKLDEGVLFFKQENSRLPKNELILKSLGALYLQQKNYFAAMKAYQQAIEVNTNCGACYAYLAQASINQEKDFKKAHGIIENGLSVAPKSPALFIMRSKIKLAEGNEPGALADLYKAIAADSTELIGYVERANFYRDKKQFYLAVKDLKKAERIAPTNPFIKNELAKNLAQDEQYNEALQMVNKALLLEPNNADSWMIKGEIRQLSNDFQGAASDFEKVLELKPDNAYAIYRLSESYYRTEEMDLFCSCINRSISISRKENLPQDDLLDFMVGQRSIVCDSTKSSYFYNRGIAAYNKGKLDESIQWHNRAIERFPNQRLLYHFKANTELAQLNFKAAIRDFNYSIQSEQAIGNDLRLDGKYAMISNDSLSYLVEGFKLSTMISLVYAHYNCNQLDSSVYYLNVLHKFQRSMPELFDMRLFLLEAQIQSDLGNLSEASIAIEELIKEQFNYPIIYNNKAWIKLQMAISQVLHHDKVVINDVVDITNLVYTLPKKMKVKHEQEWKYCKQIIDESIALDPENAETLFLKGLVIWMEKGDPNKEWSKAKQANYSVHFEAYEKFMVH